MEMSLPTTTSSTSPCCSPFDNKVTFKMIMDYVGTDHRSLMRCRLVAHSWNHMALTILNLNGTTLAIGGDRPPWGNRPDPVLQASLEYLKDMSETTSVSGSRTSLEAAYDKLPIAYYVKSKEPKIANRLLRPVVSAQVNITSITYQTSDQNLMDSAFWEVVRASSINLQTLRLNVLLMDSATVSPNVSASNEYQLPLGDVPFPKLTSFQIRCPPGVVGRQGRFGTIPTQVARLAPIIKKLRFVLAYCLNSHTDGFDFTTSEQLKKFLPSEICASAHKLEVPLSYLTTISPEIPSFRNLQLLQLTIGLKSDDITSDRFTDAITAFLGHNRRHPDTLLSLDLTLSWSNLGIGQAQVHLPHGNGQPQPNVVPRYMFPVLPYLVHLGLLARPCNTNTDQRLAVCSLLRTVASSCMGLKSLAIDHILYWYIAPRTGEQQEVPWYMQNHQVVFGKVEILLLTIICRHQPGDGHQVARMTNALFPNLKQVFVENSCEFRSLERMVMPELMEIRGISTLGFKTTYKISLTNQFLRPRLAASQLAQSLERLELKMLKCHSPARQKRPTSLHIEDLENLLMILPRLTVVAIDWKLLSGQDYGDINFQEILDEVQQLKLRFPNVDIRVL